jgi:uncharacterized protein
MRVLVLGDDIWHPIRTPRAGLAPLQGDEFAFDFIERPDRGTADLLAPYAVVILKKSNNISSINQTPWMTPGIEDDFRRYVMGGHGMLVIHSGSAGYQACSVLRHLMGGVFVRHPPQCPVTVIPQVGHPLANGSMPFTRVDEHYHMEVDDAQADVFLTTTSEHGSQVSGWTRYQGAGRIGMLTPGHNLNVWLHPSYQTLIVNTLRWCAGSRSHL